MLFEFSKDLDIIFAQTMAEYFLKVCLAAVTSIEKSASLLSKKISFLSTEIPVSLFFYFI